MVSNCFGSSRYWLITFLYARGGFARFWLLYAQSSARSPKLGICSIFEVTTSIFCSLSFNLTISEWGTCLNSLTILPLLAGTTRLVYLNWRMVQGCQNPRYHCRGAYAHFRNQSKYVFNSLRSKPWSQFPSETVKFQNLLIGSPPIPILLVTSYDKQINFKVYS